MSLFEKAVQDKELGARLLSSLLLGINKAYPFLENTEPLTKHIDALFRIVHTASFTSSTQALMLLSHLAIDSSSNDIKKESDVVKRYYRALYAKLLSNEVGIRSKNATFLNVLYKSVKRDRSEARAMVRSLHMSYISTPL